MVRAFNRYFRKVMCSTPVILLKNASSLKNPLKRVQAFTNTCIFFSVLDFQSVQSSFSRNHHLWSYHDVCEGMLRSISCAFNYDISFIVIAELRRPEGPPSGAPYSYRKEKDTHELIFSWLSWLAALLVGAYARRRRSRATRQLYSK